MKSIFKMCTLGTVALLLSANVQATEENDNAIDYRQNALSVMAWQMGPLGAMAKGDMDYNAEEFQLRANNLAALAGMPWEGFVEGSFRGGEHSVSTGALAKIATNMDDFMGMADDLVVQTTTLAELSNGDDFSAMRKQVGKVGQSCKSCHDAYRGD
ncbi:c-type cytochrome [Halomonas halocynthiae]|uniref:c-type cytochrome n=1 Tax=Halomonas halocynthiae TaxID=176290 RepID=UPI000415075E|nr:cytochrome c [Halomonas halocynthiae]